MKWRWVFNEHYPRGALGAGSPPLVAHVELTREAGVTRLVCRLGPPSKPLLQLTQHSHAVGPGDLLFGEWAHAANRADAGSATMQEKALRDALYDALVVYDHHHARYLSHPPRYIRAPGPLDRSSERHWRRKTGSWRPANLRARWRCLFGYVP